MNNGVKFLLTGLNHWPGAVCFNEAAGDTLPVGKK
jgi:hypothetical protein